MQVASSLGVANLTLKIGQKLSCCHWECAMCSRLNRGAYDKAKAVGSRIPFAS